MHILHEKLEERSPAYTRTDSFIADGFRLSIVGGEVLLDYSREFRVLATHLSFTAAALELNLSQPSLSRHITGLEKELGFKLLNRNPVELTPAGKNYLESISEIINNLDIAIEQGRSMARNDNPVLSVCAITGDAPYMDLIFACISDIQNIHSKQSLVFYENRSSSIRESIENGDADIGIIFDDARELADGFVCEWLGDAHFSAWVHKDNPLLNKQPILFSQLADCSLICSTNRQFSTWLDGMKIAYRRFGMEPRVHLKDLNDTNEFILSVKPNEVLLGNDFAGRLTRYNPNLVEILFDDENCFYSTYLLYNSKSENPIVKIFVETCHKMQDKPRIAPVL
jgi:DNA-binding transcriptional LysR family regulator